MITSRRGFIRGIGALIAAPAIVRIESLMPVRAMPSTTVLDKLYCFDLTTEVWSQGSVLTFQQITREAVKLWKNSDTFLTELDDQWDDEFGVAA